ncbi:MAG: hypothetical protein LUE27_09125 [Clostridia bacterium]|nr:hypothetical protein [Clostridia bacterium]
MRKCLIVKVIMSAVLCTSLYACVALGACGGSDSDNGTLATYSDVYDYKNAMNSAGGYSGSYYCEKERMVNGAKASNAKVTYDSETADLYCGAVTYDSGAAISDDIYFARENGGTDTYIEHKDSADTGNNSRTVGSTYDYLYSLCNDFSYFFLGNYIVGSISNMQDVAFFLLKYTELDYVGGSRTGEASTLTVKTDGSVTQYYLRHTFSVSNSQYSELIMMSFKDGMPYEVVSNGGETGSGHTYSAPSCIRENFNDDTAYASMSTTGIYFEYSFKSTLWITDFSDFT